MDSILSAHNQLESKGNLSKTIADVQGLIDQLQETRDAMSSAPGLALMHMAKLKQPVKASFDKIEEDLKEVNKGLNQYQKALREKFKAAQLPSAGEGVLGPESGLVNRAVAMHLLREGKFGVASTFVKEVGQRVRYVNEWADDEEDDEQREAARAQQSWLQDFSTDPDEAMSDSTSPLQRNDLQTKFTEMYLILDALRNHHDLSPAISWAKTYSTALENRGSNLEFELSQLKFVELYLSPPSPNDPFSGPIQAVHYARTTFPAFAKRYAKETAYLLGSLAFSTGLEQSPYSPLFHDSSIYDSVASTFTREFCGMLGLAESSPLYTAVTAGGISLPILEKVERVMAASRGQWTSVNELPVETPLPPSMLFHSIFVCPVSKEQATDANPPMMLPCGHVIARESLEGHARNKSRIKCPYCPSESHPREAMRVYI